MNSASVLVVLCGTIRYANGKCAEIGIRKHSEKENKKNDIAQEIRSVIFSGLNY